MSCSVYVVEFSGGDFPHRFSVCSSKDAAGEVIIDYLEHSGSSADREKARLIIDRCHRDTEMLVLLAQNGELSRWLHCSIPVEVVDSTAPVSLSAAL